MIGRERPSTCETISHHEQKDIAGDYVMPRITEECDSVFADSVTEAEMLETITGHNSLKRNLEYVADTILSSGKEDIFLTNNTILHEQDHSISQNCMVGNDPFLSSSSSNCDDKEETTSHPDYYSTAQRTTTTISELTSYEVGHAVF